ncbi:MAG TPA: FAD-binding oxidoreductase [Anaerolineales bacterium]|nr:FAD-binding oxidoreductase [Anaerolineales bacterium]HNO30809.1 FAD-binding oxidoreductase [Anaerolineales bacterium]
MRTTFTQLENFGHSLKAPAYLLKPRNSEEIYSAFKQAKQQGLTVTARGAGRSYNDAALNGGGIVLDFTAMDQILEWDPTTGVVRCEPGVTLEKLWQKVEPEGWWPPVVSGTMRTTLGGCLSANIHGKNNFKMGTIGEHVMEFTAVLPTGAEITCSPKKNGDLFHAMIGGYGMLGIFTSVTLQMKRIHSGLLTVDALPVQNLHRHLSALQDGAPNNDYIVGWLDTFAGGSALGRGQIHAARYVHEGEDPKPQETMKLQNQILPPMIFGVFPKSLLHYFMRPFGNNIGWRMVNLAKYVASLRTHTFRQSHAAFHFLLDYVPSWELSYGRDGLIQYQSFLPKETAEAAWTQMLSLSQKRGMPSYLGVTKRHRPDKFLLTHAVDGFSLALDFKVTDSTRAKMREMMFEFDKIVIANGGRFYFAKNSETTAETALAFYGAETVVKFKKLKKRCDPNGLLESDLYRRIFG